MVLITRNPDALTQEVWGFTFFERELFLVLSHYKKATRSSPRHRKYDNVLALYERLEHRVTTIDEASVPMPEDVTAEARAEIIKKLSIGRWSDYKARWSTPGICGA